MTQRPSGGDPDRQDMVNAQLKELFNDDEFLTGLSRGVDPSDGDDALAGLLLGMREEVSADMPAVPDLSVLLPDAGGNGDDTDPGTTEFAPITVPAGGSAEADAAAEEPTGAGVIPLGSRRSRRARREAGAGAGGRRSHPFLHGLVGAAAATLVIAGGGTAIYNADADSPLYGLNTTLFGKSDNARVVELASTLEEVDSRTASGDVEGARELLEQARSMLAEMDERQRNSAPRGANVPAPVPVTETATATTTATVTETNAPAEPAPAPAPETVTETATRTQTQTVVSTVVQAPAWTPQPTQTFQPPATPVEPVPPTGDGDGPGNSGGNANPNAGANAGGGQVAPPQIIGE